MKSTRSSHGSCQILETKTKRSSERQPHNDYSQTSSPYRFVLPGSFLMSSFVAISVLSFGLGKACRFLMASQMMDQLPLAPFASEKIILPDVTYFSNESLPSTIYTAHNFDTSFPATSSSVLARKDYSTTSNHDDGSGRTIPRPHPVDFHYHYSYGQHILIDIQNVDTAFLNHAGRLSQAMIDVSRQSHLQLLSVHCHALIPTGVTCVGVMLKSHITFHTWPDEGVILLDLMTFQRDEQIDEVVKGLEHFFGVPSADPLKSKRHLPQSKWSLKRRGFQDDTVAEQTRFERYVLGSMEYEHKHQVAVTETPFFKLQIFDTIGYPRRLKDYERSLDTSVESYESQQANLYKPDRILLLNQVVQSRGLAEAAYNEMLVHPTLLLHPRPRNVAIVGGGTGAVLREVLKHKTVESAVVVELDEAVVRLSKRYLAEWSDCSQLAGSSNKSCFDDARASVEYANGVDWFLKRQFCGDKFDVVVVDVDPLSLWKFSNTTEASTRSFFDAVYNSLSEDGILVMSMGDVNFFGTEAESPLCSKVLGDYKLAAERAGFEPTTDGFLHPFKLLMASKGETSATKLFFDEASAEVAIRQRILPTISGESSLRIVDGSALFSFTDTSGLSRNADRSLCTCEHADTGSCNCLSPSELLSKVKELHKAITSHSSLSETPAGSINPAPVPQHTPATCYREEVCGATESCSGDARVVQSIYSS